MTSDVRKGMNINISVGQSCFVRCDGCYNFFGSRSEEFSTDIIVGFIALLKMRGLQRVTFSGGDPLSRPDIVSLLEKTAGLNVDCNLDTVGTPFLSKSQTIFFGRSEVATLSVRDVSKYVTTLGIPLDGHDNHTAALFRQGRDRLFDEQIKILRLLERETVPVCLNTVAHASNINSLSRIGEVASEFSNIIKWQIFQYMPIGPMGFKNRIKYEISDRQFERIADRLMSESISYELNAKGVEIEIKTRSNRKNSYLLIDSDGIAYIPAYNTKIKDWSVNDTTGERMVIGDLKDRNSWEAVAKFWLENQ